MVSFPLKTFFAEIALAAGIVIFMSCDHIERNNPDDPSSSKYSVFPEIEQSSSSEAVSSSSSDPSSSSSAEVFSSSSAMPSSSSLATYTLACAAVPQSGTAGSAITPPTVTCNGTIVSSGLDWAGAPAWSNPAAGMYSGISVSASSGECSGKTATCGGTLTVGAAPLQDELTCTGMPATGVAGTAMTQPTVRCGLNTVAIGISWENAPAWVNPAAGAYNVLATASCGGSSKIASCGALTVAPIYTVTYSAGIGVTGVALPDNQPKNYGVPLTLSAAKPTRTGYTFVGWNTSPNGNGMSYDPGATYTDNADITLYAQWTAHTYTVIYNVNGGTGVFENQTKTHDIELTLRSAKPTREGYAFMGWNTLVDGSGTSYASGGRYTDNVGVTLYAQWAKEYTITYDANGGTGAPSNQIKIHGVELALSDVVPTRTGYAFMGWNTLADGSGTSYASGGRYTDNVGVTLYAQWAKEYTITYDANGGTGAPSNQIKIHDGEFKLSATEPTRDGLSFAGWNTSAYGNGTSYAPRGSYTANADVTLYAQWKVSFSCGDDSKTFNVKTVTIGTQTWMTENLNCNVGGSKCYENDESYCNTYGRLYYWATAMALSPGCNSSTCNTQITEKHKGVCPSGWHIPSDAEWTTLTDYVGGLTAGEYLKATSGWNDNGNGQDTYGFSALPGGYGYSDGSFYNVGNNGNWWSSSESNASDAYSRGMYYDSEDAYYDYLSKYYLFSVRCLQD